MEFLVYARDAFGNIQTKGGLSMSVEILGQNKIINATVADLCDASGTACGQYAVTYTGTLSGTYAVSINLRQEVKYMTIQGFPASRADSKTSGLPFLPASAEACNDVCDGDGPCCLMGEGASFSQALKDTTFLIQARPYTLHPKP